MEMVKDQFKKKKSVVARHRWGRESVNGTERISRAVKLLQYHNYGYMSLYVRPIPIHQGLKHGQKRIVASRFRVFAGMLL